MTPDERYFPGSGPDDPGLADTGDLFSARPAASPAEVRDELRRQTGEDVPRTPRRPDYPGIHELAQDLGLA